MLWLRKSKFGNDSNESKQDLIFLSPLYDNYQLCVPYFLSWDELQYGGSSGYHGGGHTLCSGCGGSGHSSQCGGGRGGHAHGSCYAGM